MKSSFTGGALSALAIFAITLATSMSGSVASAEGFFPYEDPGAVARGKETYAEYCASCHGLNLEGEANWRERDEDGYLPAPPHDPSGHTWHHADQQLFLITKYGTERLVGGNYKSRMLGHEDLLSDVQIVEVLAYIKSTWPQQIIDRHNDINAAQQ